jgi:predicted ATPase/DNA-binding CsgD family transcriptional regulator
VAADLGNDFPDGVHFVNLAPMSDPDLVAATIAQTLGVRETDRPLRDSLRDYLREKQPLLLLDNFEQVVNAAPLLGELLAAAPTLKALVTSREPLHLSGEHEYAVPPLSVPDPQALPPLDHLAEYAAVQLFLARAKAVKADFVVTNDSAPAVAAICQRLDGLPLALELAAARIKLLPPQALLARLDQRLKLLTGGARDAPARQQTMRAAIDWSYHLLDAGEQTLFARLGVFVGGCTLAAAEAVCNADDDLPIDVLDGLAALLDKSLLKQTEGAAPRGYPEPHFAMLETIREYALEQLQRSSESAMLRRRHAEYFLTLVEAAKSHLRGPDQLTWLTRLERDYDNLRTALAWSLSAHGQVEVGLRLGVALGEWVLVFGGHLSEARGWLEQVVQRIQSTNTPLAALRARALLALGSIMERGMQDDPARTIALLEESLTLFREMNNHAGMAEALLDLGRLARNQGDYQRAQMLEEECLTLFHEEEIAWGIAVALASLGDVALDQGNSARAAVHFQEALAISRAEGDRFYSGWTLLNLGRIAHAQGDFARATTCFDETLALFRELGSQEGVAQTLLELGRVAREQGDTTRMAEHFAESLALFQETKNLRDIAYCLEGLAGIAGASGRPERAARLLGAAEALRKSVGIPLPPVNHADYERDVAAVRAQLDEATFAAAWAAGGALSLEQAIAEALHVPVEAPAQMQTPGQAPQPASAAPERLGTLTARERQVLVLIAQGYTNRAIADALVIAERTAEIHVSNILGKLGLASRTQAAAYAVAQGLAAPPDA